MEEDEVAITSSSSWKAVEGSLERSLSIAKENDEVETPKPTSRLVLVPPSEESGPCELTVIFQRGPCYVRQIYVLSSARTLEIYGQVEQDGEFEYVSTVRGELVSLPEDELPGKAPDDCRRMSSSSFENLRKEDGVSRFAFLDFSEEMGSVSSKDGIHKKIPLRDSQELEQDWNEHSPTFKGYGSSQSRDSEEESFQSLSDEVPGKLVDGSIIFDEPLDQTDWVECPHSPMKSSALSSDDEVDINKCGFFLVDPDGQPQQTEQPRVTLFSDSMNTFLEHELSPPVAAGQILPNEHANSQVSSDEDGVAFDRASSTELIQRSWKEQVSEHEEIAQEQKELRKSSANAEVHESSLQKEADSEPDIPVGQSPGVRRGRPLDYISDVGRATSSTGSEDTGEETKEAFLFQNPTYEAELNLFSSDAWTSVKIRLLSLEDKSKLEMHKVVVTCVPGDTIVPKSESSSQFGSFQQGTRTSSLLAMLGPGIFQMARGLAESRKVNSLALLSGDTRVADSKASLPPNSTNASLSVLGSAVPGQQVSSATSSFFAGNRGQRNNFPPGEDHMASYPQEEITSVSQSSQDVPCRAGMGSDKDTHSRIVNGGESATNLDQSDLAESKEKADEQREKLEESDYCKGDGKADEVVQRLERLESICLRIENSVNFALESMDRRLKLLEGGGMRRMPVVEQPCWGAGYEAGPYVSTSSVNVPPAPTGLRTGSSLDKQLHNCTSAPDDLPAGQLPTKDVSPRTAPFYHGLLSSTSPSLLSSVSPALPLWPLSSPHHVSPESNSRASSTTTSTHSRDSHIDEMNGSGHGLDSSTKANDTYWENQTSDDSGSDLSSDSERASVADSSEVPGPGWSCPGSVASSPAKPAEQVESALASALLAFSASFNAATGASSEKENKSQTEEDDNNVEEESFTSEEQAPLVDVDCFSRAGGDEIARASTEVFMQGYEAIPVSVEKEFCDFNMGLSLEDVFWTSEIEVPDRMSKMNWQDQKLQTQEEKLYYAHEDAKRLEKDFIVSQASPDPFIDTSNVLRMEDLTTYDLFPADFERILRDDSKTEAVDDKHSEAVFQTFEQDMLPNPFLQELAFAGEGDILTPGVLWVEEGWSDKQLESGQNATVSYMTVRGFSKPLDPQKEMQLQEDVFPEQWNWFTSEVPSTPAPVILNRPPIMSSIDPPLTEDDEREMTRFEQPRSLLDEDAAMVGGNQHFRVDVHSKDRTGQKTQWSLLDDDYQPTLTLLEVPEEGSQDDWLLQRGQRSLLDDDIFMAARNVATGDNEGSTGSRCGSPEEQYDLSGVIRPPKCTDTVRSPSSHTSGSNPFGDDGERGLDVREENQKPLQRELLEDFGEEIHEFEAPESERTQSLLFHLSL